MTDKERIAELEKENAELKKELDDGRDAPTIAYLQGASRQNEKLAKAKEIIKRFSKFVNNEAELDPEYPEYSQELTDLWNELCELAEQFLKEVEK